MARITTRYFQVTLADKDSIPFSEALATIAKIDPKQKRERKLEEFSYRLERFDDSVNGLIMGEVTKIQDDNLPSHPTPTGVEKLEVDELGFGVAFIFDQKLSVLAIQYDNRIVSVSKIADYLRQFDNRFNCNFRVLPGPDSWKTFANGNIKKFAMKVALPQSFKTGIDDVMGNSIGKLASAYESPFVRIELGVGHRKLTISDAIIDTANRFLSQLHVKSMKAKTIDSTEEIDLLEEMLRDRDDEKIPSEPDDSYKVRSDIVRSNLEARRNYIASVFAK